MINYNYYFVMCGRKRTQDFKLTFFGGCEHNGGKCLQPALLTCTRTSSMSCKRNAIYAVPLLCAASSMLYMQCHWTSIVMAAIVATYHHATTIIFMLPPLLDYSSIAVMVSPWLQPLLAIHTASLHKMK